MPVNTTATVHIPAADAEKINESGKPVGEAQGVKFVEAKDGAQVYEVQSGAYEFIVK